MPAQGLRRPFAVAIAVCSRVRGAIGHRVPDWAETTEIAPLDFAADRNRVAAECEVRGGDGQQAVAPGAKRCGLRGSAQLPAARWQQWGAASDGCRERSGDDEDRRPVGEVSDVMIESETPPATALSTTGSRTVVYSASRLKPLTCCVGHLRRHLAFACLYIRCLRNAVTDACSIG